MCFFSRRPLPRHQMPKSCRHGNPPSKPSARAFYLIKLTKRLFAATALLMVLLIGMMARSSATWVDLVLRPSPESFAYAYTTGHGSPRGRALSAEQLQALPSGNRSLSVGGDRRLRLFMLADSPHIDLCKSIMSAVAAGYPAPILLNWGGEFNRPKWHLAGSHAAEVDSFLSVIQDLLARAEGEDGDVHQDDLAVLVDAHDVWFQLPPSALIQRYHQLNLEADARVHRQWESAQGLAAGFPVAPPRQSIVTTMAKNCRPRSESRPPSRYGKGTDRVLAMPLQPARDYGAVKPRCLDNGMIMGTMGALRDALTRAKAQAGAASHRGRRIFRDQALFGQVLADQETWRDWMRGLGAAWNGTASENDLSKLPRHVRRIAAASMAGERFEYGIGLDYHFGTVPRAFSAHDDGAFVKINDKEALKAESARAGVPHGQVRVDGVPRELAQADVGPKQLDDTVWGDVPLYTDLRSGVTPVGMHHHHDSKSRRLLRESWTKMWFYPKLRNLIAQATLPMSATSTVRPLARVPADGGIGSRETRYWAPKSSLANKLVQVFQPFSVHATSGGSYGTMPWQGVCQVRGEKPWHREIFGDAKGPWQL